MSAPIQTLADDGMLGIVKSDGTRTAMVAVDANGDASITQLLQLAVRHGTPVAELKELVALHEKMEERQAQKAFAAAMAAFKSEVRSIRHNKTAKIATKGGGSYSFTYASLDEMAEQVDPILARHDLSYSWNTAVDEKGAMLTAICTVIHALGHSKSSSFTLPVANESGMSPQQKVGAANHYARRQSLEAVLGLTTTNTAREEAAADPERIHEDAVVEIEELIKEVGANRAKFLTYIGAATVAEIRAADYSRAKASLEAKRRAAQ